MAARQCAYCATEFEPGLRAQRAKYCTARCRQRAYSDRRRSDREELATPPVEGGEPLADEALATVVLSHLRLRDRQEDIDGRAALALARRIDRYGPTESGSGLAALVRELRASLAVVNAAGGGVDPVDELKRRRDEKRGA